MDGWSHQTDQNHKLPFESITKNKAMSPSKSTHPSYHQLSGAWKPLVQAKYCLIVPADERPTDAANGRCSLARGVPGKNEGCRALKSQLPASRWVGDLSLSEILKRPLLQDFSRIILWTFFSSLDQLWWSSSSASTTSFLIYSEPAVPQESKKSYDTSKDNQWKRYSTVDWNSSKIVWMTVIFKTICYRE